MVGCTESVATAVLPLAMVSAVGTVQVLPATVHVVFAATVQVHPVAVPDREESSLTLPAAMESVPL